MELARCWHSLRTLKHSPCRHRLKGAGHEQDSRGHGDWIEMIRLASDYGKSLHPNTTANGKCYFAIAVMMGDFILEGLPDDIQSRLGIVTGNSLSFFGRSTVISVTLTDY